VEKQDLLNLFNVSVNSSQESVERTKWRQVQIGGLVKGVEVIRTRVLTFKDIVEETGC